MFVLYYLKNGPARDGMSSDSPELLSRFTEQQCLWPLILLERDLKGNCELRNSTHWGLKRWSGEKPPLLCPHVLYPGLSFKNRPKKNVKYVSK